MLSGTANLQRSHDEEVPEARLFEAGVHRIASSKSCRLLSDHTLANILKFIFSGAEFALIPSSESS
jgi:hypothetical protein